MKQPLVLIVDDEPDIVELLELTLSRMNVPCRGAADLAAARRLLAAEPFGLCLTDMRLPDGSGIELVEEIARRFPDLPVAVITAHGNMETAIQALKAGAFDFLSKPVDLQALRRLVQTALQLEQTPPSQPSPKGKPEQILLGRSPSMAHIRAMIRKLARSQAPVFISGESGTGKELAARLIHMEGPRAEAEFVAINCGAIPLELMESEFFGHRKGSFTGAVSDKKGLFQVAEGGTLFLDEVADLPLHMQVKLLRAIQEKSIRPIGAPQEVKVDVRIISATHKDLAALVEKGAFRQDLFYRINVIELPIPPLRQRQEDIPLLVEAMLQRSAQRNRITVPMIDPGALKRLVEYGFPGNIRELENILERAVTLSEGGNIMASDLSLPEQPPECLEIGEELPLETYLERIERELITRALDATRWNRTAAAKRLGISFRALRYRLSKLGID